VKATKAVIYAKGPTVLNEYMSFGPYYLSPLLPNGLPNNEWGRPAAFISLEHLAIYLLEKDLEPIPIPNEEGWADDIQDLDEAHWKALNELLTGKPA
jgi:hypothetical protein